MKAAIEALDRERERLYRQLSTFDDFRLGNVSETRTRCGKKNCACADKNHSGHIRYLWNTTRSGKNVTQHLPLGPVLDQAQRQVEEGRQFQKWYREVIEVNEQICRLRPVPEMNDEKELEALKKKLRRRFFLRRKKRLTV